MHDYYEGERSTYLQDWLKLFENRGNTPTLSGFQSYVELLGSHKQNYNDFLYRIWSRVQQYGGRYNIGQYEYQLVYLSLKILSEILPSHECPGDYMRKILTGGLHWSKYILEVRFARLSGLCSEIEFLNKSMRFKSRPLLSILEAMPSG